ncbi:MAG: hypothetical protein Q9160_009357, partial [Pyrenula sp. 1 TL-2023]
VRHTVEVCLSHPLSDIDNDSVDDSQQIMPWATSLRPFESQGGTTITVDRSGRMAQQQEELQEKLQHEELQHEELQQEELQQEQQQEQEQQQKDIFKPPISTAPAVLQSEGRKRRRGVSLNYNTL